MRSEICASVNDKDRRFACLYGMLLFCRTLSNQQICFQTESSISAQLFERLCTSVLKGRVNPNRTESERKNGSVLYTFEINGTDEAGYVLDKYRINPEKRSISPDIIATSSLGVFTAGVFLACGSVNDPSKEYHLEFTVPCEELADELALLLSGIGVNAKTASRRNQNIVYIKGSESIEDTLTFIGAQQCTLELMNVKIFKDVRNKANRIKNCDTANIDKVLNAAMRQLEDIQLIERTIGLDSLSDELREVAELRLENVDMSLQDICESLSVQISRSGVNHRFKKLARIAEDIRREGEKQ